MLAFAFATTSPHAHGSCCCCLLLQSLTFAVMPADDGVAATESSDFFTYVTTEFPDTATHWIDYDSQSEFLDIIGESDYSRDPTVDRPAFSAAIVFTSGSPDWAYTVGVSANTVTNMKF